MSKSIVSAPPAAFASMIACRNEPPPESSVRDQERRKWSRLRSRKADHEHDEAGQRHPTADSPQVPQRPPSQFAPDPTRETARIQGSNHSPSQNASASLTAASNPRPDQPPRQLGALPERLSRRSQLLVELLLRGGSTGAPVSSRSAAPGAGQAERESGLAQEGREHGDVLEHERERPPVALVALNAERAREKRSGAS